MTEREDIDLDEIEACAKRDLADFEMNGGIIGLEYHAKANLRLIAELRNAREQNERVQALVEKWRKVEDINPGDSEYDGGFYDAHGTCADELESILSERDTEGQR